MPQASTYLLRNFLKYHTIFKEGQKGESAYLLKEGRVELSKEVNGKKKVLAILSPISVFGEMAMLMGDQRRTATAMPLDDVKAIEVKRDSFEEFIRQSPQIMQAILDVLVHRLKVATVKSMQVPSLFIGICQILELFTRHGTYNLDYLSTAKAMSTSFVANEEKVTAVFNSLTSLKMIEMRKHKDGSKRISIVEREDFLVKSVQRLKEAKDEKEE